MWMFRHDDGNRSGTFLLMKMVILSSVLLMGGSACQNRWAKTFSNGQSPPNIVVIFCDDLGLGDVSGFGYNAPICETPELDKMAEQGMKLTHFMSPMPFCAPSRASILTGRYPFRHGIAANPTPDRGINDYGLPQDEITIAEMLKPAGYDTYHVGKWHLGHTPDFYPRRQGFDEYYGILYSNDMRPVQLVENETVVEYPVDQAYLTQKYTKRSIAYMRRSVKAGRPFFLYLAHAMPHKPLAASPDFYTPETPDDLYADVVRELDWSVGEVLGALKKMGVEKETLVIFTSDNGAYYGGSTGGLRGMKARSWDGGLRVPFIARWPGRIPSGSVNSAMASNIDLFPTIANLAGVEPAEEHLDGRDLWPMLTDSAADSPHEFLVGMKGEDIRTIYSGKWKLHVIPPRPWVAPTESQLKMKDKRGPDGVTIIAPDEQYSKAHYPGLTTGDYSRRMMLFDTETDPGEQYDLSEQFPEVVARLKAYNDTLPTPEYERPKPNDALKIIEGGRIDFWNN